MKNPLLQMVSKRRMGIHSGIPSFCCANKIALEAILEQAQRFDETVLIEATSNQVNQFGGYTSMTSMEFKDFVYQIADHIGFSRDKIILGGDHLGPLPWADLPADQAMAHAVELVKQCIAAGYKKLHLDTSMKLGDDPVGEQLPDEVIAQRGALLYEVCELAYQELLKCNPDEMKPVYVIGSEVPVPGGTGQRLGQDQEIQVTRPDAFEQTLYTYKKEFAKRGLNNAWNDIIAIVVQPGVEFGDGGLHQYDRQAAIKLCERLRQYPDIVFEGHSTDYQSPTKLRQMVEDGIAIIKVGPALTYAVREALFSLSMMEKELILENNQRANFMKVLDTAMTKTPTYWEKYYYGTEQAIALSKKYSFSDRCRYYLACPEVEDAIHQLFINLDTVGIPMEMLHQYMPNQYGKVRDGKLQLRAKELVKDAVVMLVENYNYAVKNYYVVSGILI